MNSSIRSLIVGTAGHIDHGKTLLVRALTGVDTDRLPEEKRRGITIDLGFASTEWTTPGGSLLRLSFVDVPGHRLFVRNMLAGSGGIDCVMLVISVEDSVMPQTEEHLAICTFLGITRGITVLTKSDLASEERLAEVRGQARRFLENSFLHDAPVIAASAVSKAGMDEVRQALTKIALRVPARSTEALPRLPLDRAFVMKGFGTVVTGTLQAGIIAHGQTLALEPGSATVRVRGVQMRGRPEQTAPAGSRVALNLTGVEVSDIHRGMTLVVPGTLAVVDTIDVEVALLPDAPELRHRARVRFHCFTAETIATVSLYQGRPVQPGGSALIRLKLAKPAVLLPGDRFVLRRPSPAQTIGGGRVIDAHPLPGTRKKSALAWLEAVKDASPEQQVLLRVSRRGSAGLTVQALEREFGWTEARTRQVAQSLLAGGALVAASGDLLLTGEVLAVSGELMLEHMKQRGNGSGGVKRSELRSQTRLAPAIFDAALDLLVREKKLSLGGMGGGERVSLYGASSDLPEADRAKLAAITAAYAAAGLNAPRLGDVLKQTGIGDGEARRLMTLLLRSKVIVKLGGEDLFLHESALAQVKTKIARLRGQALNVGQFKEVTGLSRKLAIPLLEYLDREQVTRKQGDVRLVL